MGQLSFIELTRRLVEGVVLFGMATSITGFVARWLLYGKVYNALVTDKVSLEQHDVLDKDGGAFGWLHHTLKSAPAQAVASERR